MNENILAKCFVLSWCYFVSKDNASTAGHCGIHWLHAQSELPWASARTGAVLCPRARRRVAEEKWKSRRRGTERSRTFCGSPATTFRKIIQNTLEKQYKRSESTTMFSAKNKPSKLLSLMTKVFAILTIKYRLNANSKNNHNANLKIRRSNLTRRRMGNSSSYSKAVVRSVSRQPRWR